MVKVNEDIKNFNIWCRNNGLKINIAKTKYMVLSLKKISWNLGIKFHNNNCADSDNCDCDILEQTNSFKYLGLHIDENLNWNIHVNNLCKYLRKMCYYFYYVRNFLDIKTCLKVYHALVGSHINYGIHIWGATYQRHLKPAQKLQTIIIKNIFKNKLNKYKTTLLNLNQSYLFKIIKYNKKHEVKIPNNVDNYDLRTKTIKTDLPKKEKYRQFHEYIFSKSNKKFFRKRQL